MMSQQERKEFYELKAEVHKIKTKLDSVFSIVKGIAIGLIIGALVFGVITLKEFSNFVK